MTDIEKDIQDRIDAYTKKKEKLLKEYQLTEVISKVELGFRDLKFIPSTPDMIPETKTDA